MFREMRRHKQTLTREACEEVLASAQRGVLSVLGDDDYPYGVPLDYVYGDSRIYFHCARVGHKIDATRAHDKASFTVLDDGVRNEGEWWLNFRSVICFGRVRRVSDEQKIMEALHAIADKYFPEDYDAEADIARNLARVEILELEVEHMSGKAVREK